MQQPRWSLDRRQVLSGLAAASAAVVGTRTRAGTDIPAAPLRAVKTTWPLVGMHAPATPVWAYNGAVPGPVLRFRQHDTLAVEFRNQLDESTTIHWHGLRVPHAMDGVPWISQPPVSPGQRFRYQFPLQDAGTFWYHPHVNSAEQVGRGLAGIVIVNHPKDPAVDRDILWALDDWRLSKKAELLPFHQPHDASHAGRIGNTVTLNGQLPGDSAVRCGERLRLRLVNIANARIFGLRFKGLRPWLYAVDGHPISPLAFGSKQLALPPGGRADLIADITALPGENITISDDYYPRHSYQLLSLSVQGQAAAATQAADRTAPARLPSNPVPKPDMAQAQHFDIRFGGGAMGGFDGGWVQGDRLDVKEMVQKGLFWTINGRAMKAGTGSTGEPPLLSVRRGQSVTMRWHNDTAFPHPMHLHGHSFFVQARNGQRLPEPMLHDTVLVTPKGHVDIAFVADNPGLWMFHCHILEHQHAGMMGVIDVSS